jgi:hypothetical protein
MCVRVRPIAAGCRSHFTKEAAQHKQNTSNESVMNLSTAEAVFDKHAFCTVCIANEILKQSVLLCRHGCLQHCNGLPHDLCTNE